MTKLPRFTGCVKNLRINNQTEDLIGEKSLHQGVGQCFPHIEKGSYFSGDAYVAYSKLQTTSLSVVPQFKFLLRV